MRHARPSRPELEEPWAPLSRQSTPQRVLALQRSAGNAAVARQIAQLARDPTGLAGDKPTKSYVKAITKSKAGWDAMSQMQRMQSLLDPANAQLAKVGVPPVTGLLDPLGRMTDADNAAFLRGNWQVEFNPTYLGPGLSDEDFGRIANVAYHECRHAEQTFRVARKLAAEGVQPDQIALRLSIPKAVAKAASEDPLSQKKSKAEWAEADAWQLNIDKGDETESRADMVNAMKDKAMTDYGRARSLYRTYERLAADDPAMPQEARKKFKDQLQAPGGKENTEATRARLQAEYVKARELAKQKYLFYANMPVEADAWKTGGLIQKRLGLDPMVAEKELDNLDDDERTMIPVAMMAIMTSGSAQEKALAALLVT